MRTNELMTLTHRLGNHRTRRQTLSVLSFPGLSIDNVADSPGTASIASVVSNALPPGVTSNVTSQVADIGRQLTDLKTIQQSQIDQLTQNTQALQRNSTARSAGSSTASTLGSVASGLFGGVFGLAPLVEGIASLFGGSGSQPAQTLTPFTLPPPIRYAGGVSGGGAVSPIDYGQGGLPRNLSGGSSSVPTVQIQVNAIDSRSFLDHSAEIAQAVRQAMLQSSSLTDTIAEL